jgi:hypothetical protein
MENVRKYIRLIIYTNSLSALSYSLTFKIPIDLLIWKTVFLCVNLGLQVEGVHLQWVFQQKNVIIVFLISMIVNAVHSYQVKKKMFWKV